MKKNLLVITVILSGMIAKAQDYAGIKNLVVLTQYQKAREAIDKSFSDSKFASKPEAYVLKASIYASLGSDNSHRGTSGGDQLIDVADAAFRKFRQMDPGMALLNDGTYQSGPINIYSAYYTSGYNDYTAKKWDEAYSKLKKAVEYSDLLIEKKIIAAALDTNVLILAGITAENSSSKGEAYKYYSRLADNKITGDGFESVYRYLVSYYFQKKDYAAFEKYKSIGASLYPKSDFFTFDKVDFAVGLETTFAGKLKAVEEVLASDPNNFKANEVLGEIIYDELNPKDEKQPLPANADELEKKMIAAFNKAAAANPGYENPFIYLGDHFINRAVKIDDQRTALSKDDVAKRTALDKKYGETMEMAKEPYEKAVDIFKSKPNLTLKDKQQYKKCVSYLGDIATFKKIQAKNAKSPDAAKYEAEEKKWNDLWESIK